jgi:hypothetical protein
MTLKKIEKNDFNIEINLLFKAKQKAFFASFRAKNAFLCSKKYLFYFSFTLNKNPLL